MCQNVTVSVTYDLSLLAQRFMSRKMFLKMFLNVFSFLCGPQVVKLEDVSRMIVLLWGNTFKIFSKSLAPKFGSRPCTAAGN